VEPLRTALQASGVHSRAEGQRVRLSCFSTPDDFDIYTRTLTDGVNFSDAVDLSNTPQLATIDFRTTVLYTVIDAEETHGHTP
jgi:hypothetical protein